MAAALESAAKVCTFFQSWVLQRGCLGTFGIGDDTSWTNRFCTKNISGENRISGVHSCMLLVQSQSIKILTLKQKSCLFKKLLHCMRASST